MILTFTCGCSYVASHPVGDRAFTCFHDYEYIIRAQVTTSINYFTERIRGGADEEE